MPEPTGQEPTPKTTATTAEVPPPTKGQEPPKVDPPAEPNSSTWDPETKAYISKLRGENANSRKKNNALQTKVDDLSSKWDKVTGAITGKEVDPEKALGNLQSENEHLVAKNAILETAIEHGIPSSSFDYWAFKINQAAEQLGENEDLGEEDLAAIAQEVKAIGNINPGTKGNGANTGVTPPKTPAPGGGDEVTIEDFKKMGFLAKSRLQQEKPDLYTRLKEESLQQAG